MGRETPRQSGLGYGSFLAQPASDDWQQRPEKVLR